MKTRSFKVPIDFLMMGLQERPRNQAAAAAQGTSRRLLESAGITFPAGAYAYVNPATSRLIVHNTQDNLDLVEAFVASACILTPKVVAHLVTVVEAPTALLQQIEKGLAPDSSRTRKLDAAPLLRHLLEWQRQPGSGVRIVSDALVNTKSGTRSHTMAQCVRSLPRVELDAQGHLAVTVPVAGDPTNAKGENTEDDPADVTDGTQSLRLELETIIGADGITQECQYDLVLHDASLLPGTSADASSDDTAEAVASLPPPAAHAAPSLRLSGSLTHRGGTQLLGLMPAPHSDAGPVGDRQWAVFLTADLQHIRPGPEVQRQEAAAPPPVVKGLVTLDMRMPELLPRLGTPHLPQRRPEQSLLEWFESCGVKPAKGASITQQGDVLHVVQTPENIDAIGGLLHDHVTHAPKVTTLTVHTVEAPAGLLRTLALQPRELADFRPFWQAVEAAVARGEAHFVNSAVVETQSGAPVKFAALQDHLYLSKFTTQNGRPQLEVAAQPAGLILEMEPTPSADGSLVELTCAHELHTRPARTRRAPLLLPRAGPPSPGRGPSSETDFPVPEVSLLRCTTGLTIANGGIRLLSLHRPPADVKGDVLWATFLRVDTASVMRRPFEWRLPVSPKDAGSDTATLRTRAYHAPYNVVAAARAEVDLGAPPAPAPAGMLNDAAPFGPAPPLGDDPFAPAPVAASQPPAEKSPPLTFPAGSSCIFDAATHTLTVRNTVENHARVENLVQEAFAKEPVMVALTTRVFEGPAALLRGVAARCADRSDHGTVLDELQAAAAAGTGKVRALLTSRTSGKPGHEIHAEQGVAHSLLESLAIDAAGHAVPSLRPRNIGFSLDWEASLQDSHTFASLSLTTAFHTAPPLVRRHTVRDFTATPLDLELTDCHLARLATALPLPRGTTRLVALWKPLGRPEFQQDDVLQVMFVTCEIEHPEG